MKIIIFAPYFYPHKGGLEQFCWEASTRLAAKGSDVTVVTSNSGEDSSKEEICGIQIVRLDSWNFLGGTFPLAKKNRRNKRLIETIFSNKIDVLITNTRFFFLSLQGLLLAKKYKVRSFHIEHGTCHPILSNFVYSFLAWFYDQTLGRLVFKLADHHLAISDSAATFARKLGAKKIKVVYNSVDVDFFHPSEKRSKDKIIITFVGRLIEAKGVQDAIRAFQAIKNVNICFQIVGTGNYEEALKSLAGKDRRIVFLGQKNKEDIRDILDSSHIFINPSYSEGLPTSVLEAGAMGCAIIATDVGGTKEIIKDGVNGFLIPTRTPAIIEKRLEELVSREDLRNGFQEKIITDVRSKFAVDNNINKLLVILQNGTE